MNKVEKSLKEAELETLMAKASLTVKNELRAAKLQKELNKEKNSAEWVLPVAFIGGALAFLLPIVIFVIWPKLNTESTDDDVSVITGILIGLGTLVCGFLGVLLFKNKRF